MFGAKLFRKLDERRLALLLGAFFLALAIPAAVLIAQAYDQLKWEAFHRNQQLAEDFAARVDAGLRTAVATEEARSFGDYSFLVVAGDAAANFVQRSPLSAFPVAGAVPGTLGYFQVDTLGTLTTPLLPGAGVDAASYGIGADEQAARRALFASLSEVLAANRLVARSLDAPVADDERDAKAEREPARVPAPEAAGAIAPAPAQLAQKAAAPASAGFVSQGAPSSGSKKLEEQIANAEATQAAFDRLAYKDAPLARSESSDVKGRLDLRPAVAGLAGGAQAATELRKVAGGSAPAAAPPEKKPASPLPDAPLDKEVAAPPVAATEVAKEPPPFQATKDPPRAQAIERRKRAEQSLVPEPRQSADDARAAADVKGAKVEFRVRTFESELEPFEVGQLDTGQLVMFRNAWRTGQRFIQGALLDRDRFVADAIAAPFEASSLAAMSDVAVSYRGRPLATLRAAPGGEYASPRASAGLAGTPLHRARLSPPFGDLELEFAVNQLPRAPGALLLLWISVTLAVVLCGGFFFMYRFAVGQLRLARQQQDFVSAVSHELKTPLTSIRMYGEMLKAGWADDAKKQTYYDFIHSESERLSRLIENVLQLARLTRSSQHFDVKRVTTAELVDLLRSKTATQVERAGFALDVRDQTPAGTELALDVDAFAQVFINLVDNALKFSSEAQRKSIEIAARCESDGRVLFTVRDFGPGIPKGELKKIFELFYRPEDEATRATAGTGIGLALVRELTAALGGRVEVRNCEPGAEFRVSFPVAGPAA